MTREEIEKLPVIIAMMLSESVTAHTNEKIHEKITEVCNLAIKALEQESVLDQISEIIEPLRHVPIGEMSDIEWDILRVIDKYKGESEE